MASVDFTVTGRGLTSWQLAVDPPRKVALTKETAVPEMEGRHLAAMMPRVKGQRLP